MLDAQTTNHELVTAAVDPADNEAWSQLHRAYHPALVRHCQRSGLSEAQAEDVAATVVATLVVRLCRSSVKWSNTSLRGWLSDTANRQIFELHRNWRRKELSEDAIRLIQEWLPSAFAPDDEGEARQKLEMHLWSVCLARVQTDAVPAHWQIFEAYALEGRSSAEVARLFNTTRVNVRIIRMRLVKRLRHEWKSLASQQIDLGE